MLENVNSKSIKLSVGFAWPYCGDGLCDARDDSDDVEDIGDVKASSERLRLRTILKVRIYMRMYCNNEEVQRCGAWRHGFVVGNEMAGRWLKDERTRRALTSDERDEGLTVPRRLGAAPRQSNRRRL